MSNPWDEKWPEIPEGTIARNIITLMKHRKIRRGQLAQAMGVVPSQMTKWLKQDDEQFTVRTMRKVAALLNVPTFALMVPAFDAEYRRISVVARYLHFVYRYGPAWPKVHRWMTQHLDALEEALATTLTTDEFTPYDLANEIGDRAASSAFPTRAAALIPRTQAKPVITEPSTRR